MNSPKKPTFTFQSSENDTWLICLSFFRPSEMTIEEWEELSEEEQDKAGDWTKTRIKMSRVECYNQSRYPGCTTLRMYSQDTWCVSVPISRFDKFFNILNEE